MRTYVLYFALIVLLTNLGYALSRLASEKETFVSLPLLLGSVGAAIFALLVVRKRLRQSKGAERTEKK